MSFLCRVLNTNDLKISFQKLHLPPELSETTQREQDDITTNKPGMFGCGSASGGRSKLDF